MCFAFFHLEKNVFEKERERAKVSGRQIERGRQRKREKGRWNILAKLNVN